MADVIDLTPLHADVSRSLAFRANKLLQEERLAEVVPTLPAFTLYLSIKEVGLDEATPLLLTASAEQRQSLVDIACWPDNAFSADELDAWLSPFAEAGPEVLASAFLSLDTEIQVLFLQQSLRIIDHRALADEHHDQGDLEAAALADLPEGKNHVKTPDGHFTLVDLSEEREVAPLALLDALFSAPDGMTDAYRLLTAARTELPSPLTEEALRFRLARLNEFGFCSPEEGAALFAKPKSPAPTKQALPTIATRGAMPPSVALTLQEDDNLFCRALGDIKDHERLLAIEHEWLSLVSRALVGYGFRIDDASAIAQCAAIVRDALSLALDGLVQGTPTDNGLATILLTRPLSYLFSLAIEQVRPLGDEARRAREMDIVKSWLEQQPSPEAGTPEGLAQQFFLGVASRRPTKRGFNPQKPHARAFWRTQREVQDARETLLTLLARVVRPSDHLPAGV